METSQSSSLCLVEGDVEDALNEDNGVYVMNEDDVERTDNVGDVENDVLFRNDTFSQSSSDLSPSRGTVPSSPCRAIVLSVAPVQKSPRSPEVEDVELHPSLLEENQHHEVPSQ